MSSRRSAEADAVSRASTTNRPTFLRLSARRSSTVSASVTRSRITVSCSASTSSRRAGLTQRGHAAADRLVQVLGPARDPGAELVQDQAEALAVGQAHDVLDQVRRDRGGRLLDRHAAARRQLLLRRARQAVQEVLADRRLRSCLAEHVRAQRAEALLGDRHLHQRLLGALVELQRRARGRRWRPPRARRRPRPGRTRCPAPRCSGAPRRRRRRRSGPAASAATAATSRAVSTIRLIVRGAPGSGRS